MIGREAAPAKLNLALDILNRRPDGFHNLRTVMQTVSLFDTVTLYRQTAGFTLEIAGFHPPETTKTLEERAVDAFFAHIGKPRPGLRVCVEKVIPAYAGLGGGSADVAALLRLLRSAYCPALPMAELEQIGLRVGSDMPFCIRGGTALAEGRGERLTAFPALPDCRFVLCKPDFGLPTPELFARADRVNWTRRPDIEALADALRRADLRAVAARFHNVFEDALPPEAQKAVCTLKGRLMALGAWNASMSGSGPTVFALFPDDAAARRAADALRPEYRETFVAAPWHPS